MSGRGDVLVLGGTGLLGRAVVAALGRRGVSCDAPGRDRLDLCDAAAVEAWVRASGPRCVLNLAAYTDVARAEVPQERPAVFRLNRDLPAALARACRDLAVPFVHVSTDYVFDGEQAIPYMEGDPPNPVQVYGASKLAGELAVQDADPAAIIARVSTLYGPGRRGRPTYVDAVLDQVARFPVVQVVETPVSSPTYAPDVATVLLDLVDAGARGVFHTVNDGGCSRLELARAIAEEAGYGDRCEVVGRPEPPSALRRPRYSVLDTGRLVRVLGHGLRPWRDALREYLRSVREADA